MFRTRSVSTLILALMLTGCNAANVQPGGAVDGGPPGAGQEKGAGQSDPAEAENAAAGSGATISNQLDQLNGRLTLLQEQLIQMKALLGQQTELGQMTLTQLQQLTQPDSAAAGLAGAEEGSLGAGGQVDAAIDQLLGVVNQLGMGGLADQYAVATTYTAKGAWILVRYRTDTGETWLADAGSWIPLEEDAGLPASSYRVWLTRADQDLKGYVAVRIDQQSGQTWWLSDRRWQVYP